MKTVHSILVSLELIGLGLWIGGMLTIGALVAPIVFNRVTPVELSGEVMSLVFRRFNGGLVYGCIVLVVIGYLGKLALNPARPRSRWIEGGLIALMVAAGIYIGAVLGPRLQELRQFRLSDPSNGPAVVQFDKAHKASERLFTINLLLGLAVLYINARDAVPARKEAP